MRLMFFGTPPQAVPYLGALRDAGHDIVAVVTQPDRPAGRGRKQRASAVREAAQDYELRVMTPESASDEAFLSGLRALEPELGVVVAYGQILRRELLELPPAGLINVHYSLLPALRGAAPVYGALRAGQSVTGVTVQFVTRKLDAGDIILQRQVAIAESDNRGTLTERLTEAGVPLLLEAVRLVERGEAPRRPQDNAAATHVGRVESADSRIDWGASAGEVRNLVRACTPRPGAWCLLRGRRVIVLDVPVVQECSSVGGRPGRIVELPNARGPVVVTGHGTVEIAQLRPEGRQAMSGADFLRGAHLAIGDYFE